MRRFFGNEKDDAIVISCVLPGGKKGHNTCTQREHTAQLRDTIPLTIKTNYSSVELPRSAFDGLVLSRAHRARDRVRVSRRSVFVRPWAGDGGDGTNGLTAPLIASPQQCGCSVRLCERMFWKHFPGKVMKVRPPHWQ